MKPPSIRWPAVAGMFYPDDPDELRETVATCLAHGRQLPIKRTPKAVIAPHAGYVYSGPIAGSAYACLKPLRDVITKVLLMGPSHRIAFRGIAYPSVQYFRTPLGVVPVNHSERASWPSSSHVITNDAAHRDEHSLEVHIPFLQSILASFSLMPLVVGDASPHEIASLMAAWWGGPETLIVVSSDLSHYLPYEKAKQLDRITSDAIERLDADAITFDQACGRLSIQALLMESKKRNLTGTCIDLRNSGDTAGDQSRVVGYGAYVFTE